jgi:hypothetical protein
MHVASWLKFNLSTTLHELLRKNKDKEETNTNVAD